MRLSNTRTATGRGPELHSLERARLLCGSPGKPASREKVLAAGLRGELTILQVAGRFFATAASVEQYREQHGLG